MQSAKTHAEPHTPELQRLQARTEFAQTALAEMQDRLEHIEGELTQFLDHYYQEVGAAFETLQQLEQSLAQVQGECFPAPKSASLPDKVDMVHIPPSNASPEHMRRFYHQVAQVCHPDRAVHLPEEVAAWRAEAMKALNHAYARKNLAEMWRIKWELEQQQQSGSLSEAQQYAMLQRQNDQIEQALEDMQKREAAIRRSPAFLLMQHAQLMRLAGQDFIALVKKRAAAQIDEKRRALRLAKWQQRCWNQVRQQRSTQHAAEEPASQTQLTSA